MEIPLKKVHQKIKIALKFKWKILYKLIGPRKKINSEFPSNLIWDSLKFCINWSDLEKNYKRIPFKFDLGSFYREILCVFLQKNSLKNFTGKSFYFFSTFRLIFKKSYQEGVFDFFIRTPNLSKFSNPHEICQDIFFHRCISLYKYSV